MVTKAELKDALDDNSSKLKQFFKVELDKYEARFSAQTDIINNLTSKCAVLEKKVRKLEKNIDDEDAYERRDTVILSGSVIAPCAPDENCATIVIQALKDAHNITIPFWTKHRA